MKPLLLDLFCGEGGAAAGYQRAGFDVIGVDLADKSKRYPGTFVQADALDYLGEYGHLFDAIHASPPCQAYSIATAAHPEKRAAHPRLIATTRRLLKVIGRPYVIENVAQARSEMPGAVTLCGSMFGLCATDTDGTRLELRRHRLFEANFDIRPLECRHGLISEHVGGVYGGASTDRRRAKEVRRGGYTPAKIVQEQMMGITWMTQNGLNQSIPPAYSFYVGLHMRGAINA